jgi:flagellar protein FlaJ
MNSYERFCFNLLGKWVKTKRDNYLALRNDLISARFKTPFEVYLSTAYVSSIVVGLVFAFLIGIISWVFQLPALIKYKGAVPDVVAGLSPYSIILGTIFITIFSLLVFGGLTYLAFILYPGLEAGNRRRNIDASLPYAINYITSMSTAGITPAEVFRLLGSSTIYGQSAVEARYIAREIDIFGRDLIDALRLVSATTPSRRMKEFLQGTMASVSGQKPSSMHWKTVRPRKCSSKLSRWSLNPT